MGFLDKTGVADVVLTESDFSVANGVYPATITDSKVMHPGGDESRESWQISYRIDPEVETYGGRWVSEFFDLDPNLSDDKKQWLKRRLASLEIPDDELADMQPQDIIGTEVTVTVKNKPSKTDPTVVYTNVTKVVLGSSPIMSNEYLSNF